MKKLSCVLAVALVLCMMLSSSAFAAMEVTYSTKSAGSVQDQAMDLFAQKLEELSDGRIVGKKYIAGTVGGEEEMAEAVALGDLGATFAADQLIGNCANGALGFLAMPGLVTSYEEAEEAIYSEDGWLSKIISNIMEEKIGLKRLAAGDNDFRVLGVNKELKTAEDAKGVKVRCGNAWANLQFYERAGFMPVVIASSETMSALEQGTVDGAETHSSTFFLLTTCILPLLSLLTSTGLIPFLLRIRQLLKKLLKSQLVSKSTLISKLPKI